jgi:hypothetical protein
MGTGLEVELVSGYRKTAGMTSLNSARFRGMNPFYPVKKDTT